MAKASEKKRGWKFIFGLVLAAATVVAQTLGVDDEFE